MWMKFLEQFPYVIKYKKGNISIVADAISGRHAYFLNLEPKFLDLKTYLNFADLLSN